MDVPLAAELISSDAMLPRQSGDVVAAVAAFRGEFARRNVADPSDINVVQRSRKGSVVRLLGSIKTPPWIRET